MPRKKKPKAEPTQLSEVLETLPVAKMIEQPATEPERQVLEPQKHVDDTNVVSMPQASEIVGEHTAAVVARRPKMQPSPAGFVGVASFPPAGVRATRGVERWNFGTAGIQFDEKKPLSRAGEYEMMSKLQDAGFQYQPPTRQWERRLPEGIAPGDNTLQAVELAREIATARNEGRGR